MSAEKPAAAAGAATAVVTPYDFGRATFGPLIGEFCLRLWSVSRLLADPSDTTLLFCARGGLRMQLAYETFLASSGLSSPVPLAPFMVSRLAAVRGSLLRVVHEGLPDLLPAAGAALTQEFAGLPVRAVTAALGGVELIAPDARWDQPVSPPLLAELLHHRDGADFVDQLAAQDALFAEHLQSCLDGRRRAVLVDTGLYGTTRELLAEGRPTQDVGAIMLGRTSRPGRPIANPRSVGLLVDADGYVPWRRRTAVLRYWHLVESVFEPNLPSVRTFRLDDGAVVSNLQVPGWESRIPPDPGTVFSGVVDYLGGLTQPCARSVTEDSDRAWSTFRRMITWPGAADVPSLDVGSRTHDFGLESASAARPWRGPVAALRGHALWREGEIATSGTRWRLTLFALIEAAYSARWARRRVRRRTTPDLSQHGATEGLP